LCAASTAVSPAAGSGSAAIKVVAATIRFSMAAAALGTEGHDIQHES